MSLPQASPISQLLHTLGLTREDLEKRSDQMRQFLTAQDLDFDPLRVTNPEISSSGADIQPMSMATTSAASSSRSRSRASSYSLRETPPPITPVKSEMVESSVPLRHFDSMEMVIERQRRQNRRERKGRRERERESGARTNAPQPPSPSPSTASQAGPKRYSGMDARDDQRVLSNEVGNPAQATAVQPANWHSPPPITPQRSKYYREHTQLSTDAGQEVRRADSLTVKEEQLTPTRPITSTLPQTHLSQPQYYPYPQYMSYAQFLSPLAYGHPGALPVTPRPQRTTPMLPRRARSPLPPSSPPASSPISTPNRPNVNLVSSPGPMGPLPDEEEYDTLPFTLPPGPYSPNKPDASYAALVGQAILSSPEHRLTLQEIYDYITIVYPFFKRDEQTWMNSIRHVLSTTVCFRKVPRERSVGRTLWAIWDEDLECFKGGGFRKQLCKDIMGRTASKDNSKTKLKGRKRADAGGDATTEGRKAKRPKNDHPAPSASSSIPATFSYPIFPPTRPTPHHQPYYESCISQSQPLPSDIIFPPLPPGVAYTRIGGTVSAMPSSLVEVFQGGWGDADREGTPNSTESYTRVPSPPPSSASSVSVPELTPNRSSSSSPPATSDLDMHNPTDDKTRKTVYGGLSVSFTSGDMDDDRDVSADDEEDADGGPVLRPVKFWGGSPKAGCKPLQPGIKLGFNSALDRDDNDDEEPLISRSKAVRKLDKGKRKHQKRMTFPPVPASPTLNRKATSKTKNLPVSKADAALSTLSPSTPPRTVPVSSVRMPLSKKEAAALGMKEDQEVDMNRTPRKRLSDAGTTGPAPVTPKKLVFPPNQNESPYRTPGGVFGMSPFRTPSSRAVFDPHDPGALLDDELSRMGAAGHGDSPGGLFGKARGSLLYDSPGLSSPDQWQRWW